MIYKILNNISLVLKDRRSMIAFSITFVLIGFIIYSMTDYPLIRGNLGHDYYIAWIVTDILFLIGFSFFVAGFTYKSLLFGNYKSTGGWLGGFFGVLVTGCTSCSITIASYLGLAGLISLLPGGGIEIKIVGLILILYAAYNTYNKLTECKVKKR